MITFLQSRSSGLTKMLTLSLAMGCLTLVSACNNAQEISDESTLGSNNAAQTNPDKIERNSMDDVARAKAEQSDDQVVIVEADQ